MSGIHWIKVEGNHMEYGKPVKSHSSPSNKSFPESVLSGQPLCIDVMRPLATAQVAIRAEELRYSLPLNGCIKASCLELNHPMNPIKCVKYMHCSRDSMHLYAFQQLTNRMLFDYINIRCNFSRSVEKDPADRASQWCKTLQNEVVWVHKFWVADWTVFDLCFLRTWLYVWRLSRPSLEKRPWIGI